MFRLIIIGLALMGLLTIYGFYNDSAKQELAQTESYVHQAQKRILKEVETIEASETSKEITEWVSKFPGPSPRDFLELRVLVDKIHADPKAASQLWAEWRTKYQALCKDKLQPHLPNNMQCVQTR